MSGEGKMELEELNLNKNGEEIVVDTSASKKTESATAIDMSDVSSEKSKGSKKGKGSDTPAEEPKAVSYLTLYRFATKLDIFYIM
jgi:hypothetical protein